MQSRKFDQVTREFILRNSPSSWDIIAMSNSKSRKVHRTIRDSSIIVTAHQLAQVESAAFCQVTKTISLLWNNNKYGHAPRKKPEHSISLVMQNFSSFCVTSGNLKINAIINLCQDFKNRLVSTPWILPLQQFIQCQYQGTKHPCPIR